MFLKYKLLGQLFHFPQANYNAFPLTAARSWTQYFFNIGLSKKFDMKA